MQYKRYKRYDAISFFIVYPWPISLVTPKKIWGHALTIWAHNHYACFGHVMDSLKHNIGPITMHILACYNGH